MHFNSTYNCLKIASYQAHGTDGLGIKNSNSQKHFRKLIYIFFHKIILKNLALWNNILLVFLLKNVSLWSELSSPPCLRIQGGSLSVTYIHTPPTLTIFSKLKYIGYFGHNFYPAKILSQVIANISYRIGEGVSGHCLIWASGMAPPKLRHILGCLAFSEIYFCLFLTIFFLKKPNTSKYA